MICGSAGSKSRLAKAAGAEPCRQIGDGTLHAVVARSTFPMLAPLLEVDMSKNCTQLWREARSEVKMYKTHTMFLPLLEVEMSKKCTPLWREAHFQVNMLKTQKRTTCLDHFWTFRCCLAWQAQGILHLPKSEQNAKVLQQFKNVSRRGTCEQDLQRCISRGKRNTRDMFTRDVRRSGRRFPERGCILEHQICRFATMILHDRCSTSYDLGSLFRGRRSILDRRSGKIAKRIGARPSPLLSTFHFWRKSRTIASFLMSSTRLEEVSLNVAFLMLVKFKI